ncbi:MAG: uroporphyrinogen-III synthase [Candidatus Acidiferrales bacterium]
MIGENKPLAGKRVVVTRASEQAHDFVARLQTLGAEVLLLPTVGFADPVDTVLLDAALRAFDRFDWIVFTSENAVRFVKRRLESLHIDLTTLHPLPKCAAVGPMTASAAASLGFAVDRVAGRHSGESLAAELRAELAGKRVLLPRSDLANDDLPRALRETAGQVIDIVAYRTVSPGVEMAAPVGRIQGVEEPAADVDVAGRIGRGEVDVVTFASPSAFRQFAELFDAATLHLLAGSARFAAIGPTTAGAIREAGWPVAIEAEEATSKGLADAIAAHFEHESLGAKRS